MPQDSNEQLLEALLVNGDKHSKSQEDLLESIIVQNGKNGTAELLEAQLVNEDKNSKAILQAIKDIPTPEKQKDFPEADFKETNILLKELLEETKKKEEFEVSISAEDRLKLKGDKGEPGIDGKGKDGIDGLDGKDGKTGVGGKAGKDGKDGKGISAVEITVIEKKIKKAVSAENNLLWVNNGAVKSITAGANIIITGDAQNPIISSTDLVGTGDMILASVQTVTGKKTFDSAKIAVKGSSTGVTDIATANASINDYTATLPAKSGTVAMLSDITAAGGSVTTAFTAQTSVVVTHNLGAFPVVDVIDNTNAVIIPLSITHSSVNAFTVVFTASTTGNIIATIGLGSSPTMTATVGGLVPTPPNDESHFLKGNGTWGHPHFFSQYVEKSVTNTTVKTSLFGTGSGSPIMPANFFDHLGKPLHMMMMGYWSKSTNGTLALVIEVTDSGGTQEIHRKEYTNAQLGGATSTVGHWQIDMMVTCYGTGVTGSIMTHAMLSLLENTSAERLGTHTETSQVTVDTTGTIELKVTATWGTASSNLLIRSSNVMLT